MRILLGSKARSVTWIFLINGMYLLDTNVLSELRKKERCNRSVRQWIDLIRSDDLWISVLVAGEIRKGIQLIQRRDPISASNLEKWLTDVLLKYSGRILPITLEVTEEWGRLNAVRSMPSADSLMAATANVHRLTLVTRNTGDLSTTGARLLNPFD